MTTFYTIDAANARVPEVRDRLLRLRDDRSELVRLRDRLLVLQEPAAAGPAPAAAGDHGPTGPLGPGSPAIGRGAPVASERRAAGAGEDRRIQLRMQGVIDQMQALVSEIDGWGISLRDIDSGLIDFPALLMGRQIWLCWRLGEGPVEWWHELNVGFSARRRLSDMA